MGPRRLTPRFLEKVWGSTRLEPLFNNSDQKIGEVWFEGVESLPLLIKFLFTSEKLSVQVHPDDDYAGAHHNSPGKTEMWHVIAAEPGAQIAAGFRETLTPEQLREAALSGEIESLLQWFDAAAGDTFFIPAGTVHAIGGGLTLCEIQQHSDVTYRLYDYGRPRELHLDRAVAVSDLGPHAARRTAPDTELVSCRYFTTERVRIESNTRLPSTRDFQIVIGIQGSGQIQNKPFIAGDVWYFPPDAPAPELSGNAVILRTY